MKNQVKRWTAFALVMAMIFSVLTPVFAEGTGLTLTVTASTTLADSNVYAVKGMSATANEDGSYTYTLTDDFAYFLENATAEELESYGMAGLDLQSTTLSQDVYDALCTMNATELKTLGEAIQAFIPSDKLTTYPSAVLTKNEADTLAVAEIKNLDPGYYIIISDSDSKDNTPAIATITSDMTITMKFDKPEVDKTVYDEEDEKYVDSKETVIGQIHQFKLETFVPYVDEKTVVNKFALGDELTLGLKAINATVNADGSYSWVSDVDLKTPKTDIGNFVTVTLGNKTLVYGEDYTINALETDKCGKFEVVLDVDKLFTPENTGKMVTVYYFAQVIDGGDNVTPIGIVATNSSYVEYNREGNVYISTSDLVNLLNVRFTIDKWSTTNVEEGNAFDNRGDGTYSLQGAKFKLYRINEETKEKEYYKLVNNVITWVSEADAEVFTTGQDGQVQISKINIPATSDTYYLVETEAPTGYSKLTSPITLVVTKDGLEEDQRTPKLSLTIDRQDSSAWTVSVQNEPTSWLPSTGSIGTYLFIAAGVALIIGATLLKKRPNSAK